MKKTPVLLTIIASIFFSISLEAKSKIKNKFPVNPAQALIKEMDQPDTVFVSEKDVNMCDVYTDLIKRNLEQNGRQIIEIEGLMKKHNGNFNKAFQEYLDIIYKEIDKQNIGKNINYKAINEYVIKAFCNYYKFKKDDISRILEILDLFENYNNASIIRSGKQVKAVEVKQDIESNIDSKIVKLGNINFYINNKGKIDTEGILYLQGILSKHLNPNSESSLLHELLHEFDTVEEISVNLLNKSLTKSEKKFLHNNIKGAIGNVVRVKSEGRSYTIFIEGVNIYVLSN